MHNIVYKLYNNRYIITVVCVYIYICVCVCITVMQKILKAIQIGRNGLVP